MKTAIGNGRRPFWLPASNYYVLAFGISIAFFFLIWGILNDAGEEMPCATAGVSASVILIASVILREFVLRRASRNLRLQQRPWAPAISHPLAFDRHNTEKLTLERN